MDIDDLDADPLVQIQRWLDEATEAGVHEPDAMSLATADRNRPAVRTVLLKGVDSGLVFYTNYRSGKAADIRWSGHAAASLTWTSIGRQIRAAGLCAKVTAQESDAYFATRPRGSQLAAWASPQSKPIADRDELDRRVAEAAARFPDDAPVPRPSHWGGYRLLPTEIEFWSRRDDRLHDRFRFRRRTPSARWRVDRLAP